MNNIMMQDIKEDELSFRFSINAYQRNLFWIMCDVLTITL